MQQTLCVPFLTSYLKTGLQHHINNKAPFRRRLFQKIKVCYHKGCANACLTILYYIKEYKSRAGAGGRTDNC